jgi:hypothetical protein
MSEPIKPGDLVMVVRPSECGCRSSFGRTFRVSQVWHDITDIPCPQCGVLVRETSFAFMDTDEAGELFRLKRIPPLSELDDVKNNEEITA